jgi:acyl-CoA thioester hydrolase
MEQQIFLWPLRVYYEDTDAGGVVYHSQYLNFLERARTEWLRHLGFSQQLLRQEQDVVFAVYKFAATFQWPARLDDLLSVSVRLSELRPASLTFIQRIDFFPEKLSVVAQSLSASLYETLFTKSPLLQAEVKLSAVSACRFRPCPIPATISSIIYQQQFLLKRI